LRWRHSVPRCHSRQLLLLLLLLRVIVELIIVAVHPGTVRQLGVDGIVELIDLHRPGIMR
jgi:hypothetical protein